MAHLIVEICPCDQGHYGSTYYNCSECDKRCDEDAKKCPHCGVVFDEASEIKMGRGYGGHDFI